jgi:hypothetical protein
VRTNGSRGGWPPAADCEASIELLSTFTEEC